MNRRRRPFLDAPQRRITNLATMAAGIAMMLAGAFALPLGAESLSSILSHSPYSPSERQQIASAIHRAGQEDVPQGMLLPRLQEGIARGVSSELIIEVLRHNTDQLVSARSLLRSVAGGDALLADQSAWSLTATLLAARVRPLSVERLARASEANSLTYRSAVLLYGSLANWGIDGKQTLQVCLAVIHSHLPAGQYSGISQIFVRSREMRIPPDRMVERLLNALPRAANYEDLEQQVLY